MGSCIFAGSEWASFLSVLTQGEMHVISCISLMLPHCSAIILLAGDTALKPPFPSVTLHGSRSWAAWFALCQPRGGGGATALRPQRSAAGAARRLLTAGPLATAGGSLLSHVTDAAPVLIKKKICLLFLSKYLSSSDIPGQNTPAIGMLLLIQGNLLHGPLLSNLRLTSITHYFVFLPASLLLNALCHPAY